MSEPSRREIVVRLVEAQIRARSSILMTGEVEISKAVRLADQIIAKTAEPLEEWSPK